MEINIRALIRTLSIVIFMAIGTCAYGDETWPIRVLSIDGGGIRGIVAAKVISKIEAITNQS